MSEYNLSATLMVEDKFSVEIDKYKNSLNGMEKATSKVNSKTSSVGKDFGISGVKKVSAFNKSLSSVGTVVSNIGRASSSGFSKFKNYLTEGEKGASRLEKAVKKMDERMSKIGSKGFGKLTNFASNAAKGVAAVGVATGVMAIKGAADLETYSMMLETAFKGNKTQAQDYYKWANKFANETPYSNAEVIEGTVKLSMRGIDPKEVLGKVGDLAASLGKPIDQAVEAILDAATGEMERMKEFGITKEDVIAKGADLGFKDLVDKGGKILRPKKFLDVMFKVMEERSKGSMLKLSKTFKGQMSTLLGVGQSVFARFAGMQEDGTIRAGSAFDRIKSKLEEYVVKLNDAVADGTVDNWAEKFDDFSEKVGVAFDNIVTSIGGINETDISEWSKKTYAGIESVFYITEKLADTIKFLNNHSGILKYGTAAIVGAKAGAWTGGIAGSIIPGAGNAIGAGFGALIGGITGILGVGLYDSQKNFEGEQKVLSRINSTKDIVVRDDLYDKFKTKDNLIETPLTFDEKLIENKIFEKNITKKNLLEERTIKNKFLEENITKNKFSEKTYVEKNNKEIMNETITEEKNINNKDKNINSKNKGLFSKGIVVNITGNMTFNNGNDIDDLVEKIEKRLTDKINDNLLLLQ
ncbi:MAG: hypothetical protein ACRCXY_00790 [Fusobacteriaceae bacterium]